MRKLIATLALAVALAFGGVDTAEAQVGPVITGGLVNVTVTNLLTGADILSHNNVGIGVAAAIAANVCGLDVNVLSVRLARGETVVCENEQGDQEVRITQRSQGRRR